MAAPATEDALPPSTLALHNLACLDCRFRHSSSRPIAVGEAVGINCVETLNDTFVPRNQPAVLRGALNDWIPIQKWIDDSYLRDAAPDSSVSVRRADAKNGCVSGSGTQYQSTEMAWPALIDAHIDAASRGVAAEHYPAQLRLRTALPRLFADCQPVPPLCGALGPIFRNAPSAYFGCGHATPLHFDLLENILCVVRGRKLVTLWHPADSHLLYPMEEASEAAFSRANVYEPDLTRFPLLEEAQKRALHVELNAGDALYLPVCWWHAIRTPIGERSISVTYHCEQPQGKRREPVEEWQDEEDG